MGHLLLFNLSATVIMGGIIVLPKRTTLGITLINVGYIGTIAAAWLHFHA